MNQDIRPVSFAADGHPGEDQLLLALERELPNDDAARVEQHLGNCWSCRARSDEMQRGILAFVEYREKRYLPALPTPPQNTGGFRDRLRRLKGESDPVGLHASLWRRLVGLLAWPRQVKWISAVAAAMAFVIFWVYVLIDPRTVSANEFLSRAAVAQNPPTSSERPSQRRVAHQKIRIRNGKQTVIRDFEWNVGSPIQQARWVAQADPTLWDTPLTAEGFANWRESLAGKQDKVRRSGHLLTLATTTDQGRIKQAQITVREDDFHPLEQHLRFKDEQQLEITELSFQITGEAQSQAAGLQTGSPAKRGAGPVLPPANLDEVELQLRYTLFTNQWDLGEDLSIGRASGRVILSGTVSSPEREKAMQATLSTLPNIQLSIDRPASNAQIARSAGASAPRDLSFSSTPLLRDVLANTFSSRDERLAFVDRCLSDSDTALAHAWALKRLVDRYGEAEERQLKPESEAKFREMLRSHLHQLSRASSGLDPLLELLPSSDTAVPVVPSDWRARIRSLFAVVQRQDRLTASLVVGSETQGQNIATVSAEFLSAHQAISALLAGLKDLAGEPTPK